jgi:CheY-like chemotaxis protein
MKHWHTPVTRSPRVLIGARMTDVKTSILIVEDEESVRTSLAEVLSVLGHRVRSASDGLAALIEMRQEAPDILLSDLNMPEMSGFELLSVVRRRFPDVRVIAMSGAFSGDQVPCGVTADAFYPKGCGVAILMRAIESPALSRRPLRETPEPIWIQRNGHDTKGAEFVTIACPDCFRTFQQVISGAASLIFETSCIFCHSSIHFGIVEPFDPAFPQRFQPAPRFESPRIQAPQFSNAMESGG